MASISLKKDFRQTVSTERPSVTLTYIVTGAVSEAAVRSLVQGTIPAFYNGLFYQDYSLEHLGNGVWDVDVTYGPRQPPAGVDGSGSGTTVNDNGSPGTPGNDGTVSSTGAVLSASFDTTGGTAHVSYSKRTVAAYYVDGNVLVDDPNLNVAPDFKGAVNVTQEGIEGTDVVVPVLNFTLTRKYNRGQLPADYLDTLFGLIGKKNAADFTFLYNGLRKRLKAGECLFMGYSAQAQGNEGWEFNYKYAASPNVTNLDLGGGLILQSKKGWDYVWLRWQNDASNNVLTKKVQAVYVERMYLDGDFTQIRV